MKHGKDFTIIPNKLMRLGLDVSEVATFVALKMHGNNGGNSMFPSLPRLMKITGQSRDRLWKSLTTLKNCNVIQWDRGDSRGRANTYHVLGEGCWAPKGSVDNSADRVDKSKGGSTPDGRGASARRTGGSTPDGPQPDESEPDEINQSGTFNFFDLVDGIKKRAEGKPTP